MREKTVGEAEPEGRKEVASIPAKSEAFYMAMFAKYSNVAAVCSSDNSVLSSTLEPFKYASS